MPNNVKNFHFHWFMYLCGYGQAQQSQLSSNSAGKQEIKYDSNSKLIIGSEILQNIWSALTAGNLNNPNNPDNHSNPSSPSSPLDNLNILHKRCVLCDL